MQVEADHHGDRRAYDFTHAAQQFTLPVFVMFGHHRSVQIEVDRLQLGSLSQSAANQIGHALESVARYVAARFGGAPAQRVQLMAGALRRIDKSAQRDIEPGHGLDQCFTDGESRPAVGAFESLERRQVRREGIGFVLEAADGDNFYRGHENTL
jgi:hypothetical protein